MGFLSEYFADRKYLNLAEAKDKKAVPRSIDKTSDRDLDVKEKITDLYNNDWYTFATVNVCSNLLSKPKTKLITTQQGEKLWEEFFEDMRLYGDNTSLRRLRAELKRDAVKYGAGYVEFVFDEEGKIILDLKRVNAAKIGPARERTGDLILDKEGKPIGYVVNLGKNANTEGKGDQPPLQYADSLHLKRGDIFLKPNRIAELPYYRLENGIDVIGVIEPAIQQANRRRDLESAQVNAIWIRGTAPLFGLVGDPSHEPNAQMVSDMLDALTEMKNSNVAAFPYYQKPEVIDAKVDDISTKIMDYLMEAEAGAANLPKPFVTGSGEATNRSTLKTQREVLEESLQAKIDEFDEDWNHKIMDYISEVNMIPRAKILTEEIRLESKEETAKRLKIYVDMGDVMSPKEIRETIYGYEKFYRDDNDYEKFLNERKEIAQQMGEKNEQKVEEEDEETTQEE
jgi:hypothetical protein